MQHLSVVDHSNDHGNSVQFIRYSYVIEYVHAHVCLYFTCCEHNRFTQVRTVPLHAHGCYCIKFTQLRYWKGLMQLVSVQTDFRMFSVAHSQYHYCKFQSCTACTHTYYAEVGRTFEVLPVVTSFAANDYLNYCFALTLLLHQWKTIKRM